MKPRISGKKLKSTGPARPAAEPVVAYLARSGDFEGDVDAIRKGVSYHLMHSVQTDFDLSDKYFARLLGISGKTLFRLKKSDRKLPPLQADRVYRLRKIRELANKVLESPGRALAWLSRPQPGLGGAVPLELLDTEPGYEQVQLLLNQLEFGVLP